MSTDYSLRSFGYNASGNAFAQTLQETSAALSSQKTARPLDLVLSFCPDSIRVLRVVCRALNPAGKDFLKSNRERLVRPDLTNSFALYNLIFIKKIYCIRRFMYEANRFDMHFHLSIPMGLRAMGINCPDKVLHSNEVCPLHAEVQKIQDANLQKVWKEIRTQAAATNSYPTGAPEEDAPAEKIRVWMQTNESVLGRISKLCLSGLHLQSVPAEIGLCTGLKELDLNDNDLISLPEGLFLKLSRLEKLSLQRNHLSSLSGDVFWGLTGLKELYLDQNDLTSLPEDIFHPCEGLEKLHLGSNRLHSLPEELLHKLPGLRELSLSGNRLISFPEKFFHGLRALQVIFLYDNPNLVIPYETLLAENNISFE